MRKFLFPFALAALASFSLSAFAANEVRLVEVRSNASNYPGPWQTGRFEVLVANLAFAKQVNIHIKQKNGSWRDFPLAYNRPANNGREVWAADFNLNNLPTDAGTLTFVVSYTVSGQTYWDNNNGANYTLAADGGVQIFGTNVYSAPVAATTPVYGNSFYNYVTVKHLGADEKVTIVYSTDGWKTTKYAAAMLNSNFWLNTYNGDTLSNPSPTGFEAWNFVLDVTGASKVEYAVSYTVNGQTYWDNNYGYNYKSVITH